MALPLSQNAQARALLRHLLEHGDTLGMDIAEGTNHSAGTARQGSGEVPDVRCRRSRVEDGGVVDEEVGRPLWPSTPRP